MRKLTYNLKRRPSAVQKSILQEEHVLAITAMTHEKILDFHTVAGGVLAKHFNTLW